MRGGGILKWFKSFRIKTFLQIFIIMFIIITIIFTLVIKKVRTDTENQFYARNKDTAELMAESINLYLSEFKSNMKVLAYSEEIQNYNFNNAETLLQHAVKTNPSISQIYLIDKEGIQFYKTSYLETLGDRSDRVYFQKSVVGETFISDVVISRSTGEPITVISTPIYRENEIVGVLGASIDLRQITSFIELYNKEQLGYAYLVDNNGRVIFHPQKKYVEEMLDVSYLEPVQQVLKGEGHTGTGRYIFDGEEKIVAYASIGEGSWGILVQISVIDAFKEIDKIQNSLFALLVFGVFCIIIASISLSNYFMRPINTIIHSMEKVQVDRKNFEISKPLDYEFGLIQKAFVRLMNELNELYNSLEDRINKRTMELSSANKELEDMNFHLQQVISELEETQEKLILSEKVSALGRIIVRISHELNTPLGNCISVSSFLVEKNKKFRAKFERGQLKKSDVDSFANEIGDGMRVLENGLQNSIQIINHLKELPRKYQLQEKQVVYIKDELKNAKDNIKDVSKCKNYKIQISCNESICFKSWKGALQEIFEELFHNSLQHGCRIDGEFIVEVKVYEDDNEVEIVYKDNGPGINSNDIHYVFEPMYKSSMSSRGMGMGLTKAFQIAKNILEGEIVIDEQMDEGIKIIIRLPK